MPVGLFQLGKTRKPIRVGLSAKLQALADAASTRKAKPKAKGGPVENLTNAGNPQYLWGRAIPKGRRCQFKHKTGKRCGCWAVKGSKLCWQHGGLLDVPDHPSAAKALHYVEAEQARRAARQELRAYDRQTVETIRQAIKAKGHTTAQPWDTLEGVQAYTQDDNGRAYRRWLANLTQPTDGQRNRKTGKNRASH
jgi:hypothetical protein